MEELPSPWRDHARSLSRARSPRPLEHNYSGYRYVGTFRLGVWSTYWDVSLPTQRFCYYQHRRPFRLRGGKPAPDRGPEGRQTAAEAELRVI